MSDQNQATSPTTYAVAEGDTMFQIAKNVYGDRDQWHAIYNANQAAIGNDPTQLSRYGARDSVDAARITQPKSAELV